MDQSELQFEYMSMPVFGVGNLREECIIYVYDLNLSYEKEASPLERRLDGHLTASVDRNSTAFYAVRRPRLISSLKAARFRLPG